jgi:hypothetical protein
MSGSVPGAIQPITPYQAPDVAGMAGQYAGLQNQLLQNQQTQQVLAARQAIGQAYAQSVNPDGSINTGTLMNKIVGGPGAYLAGDAAAQAQAREAEQYTINQQQLAQTSARLGVYKSAFAPLLANPQAGPNDVYSTIKGLAAAGMPTDEIAGDVAATMPVADPAQAGNPAYQSQYEQTFHSWLQNQWGSNLSGETQATVFRPSVSLVNTGGGVQGVDTNPTTNPGAANTSLANTLTPAEVMSQVSQTTPGGTPYSQPLGTVAAKEGYPGLVAGGGSGGAGGGNSIFANGGRLPGRGAPYTPPAGSGGASSGAAPTASGIPSGAIQTGISPSDLAGQTVAGSGSAGDYHTLLQNVSTSGGRLYQLGTALTSLQSLGTGGTGPGTPQRNEIMSFLQSLAPNVTKALGITNPNQIANYDEATKYLTAYASNQAGSLGTGTDAKLAAAFSGNASTHISNLAAVNVVKATMGLERMQQAQAQAFQQSGLPASQYDTWATNWNKTADARAYSFDLMSPQQRSTVLSGMSGSQRTGFLNQVWTATQGGFLDPGKLGITSGSGNAPASSAPAAAPSAPSGPQIDPNTGLPVGITP